MDLSSILVWFCLISACITYGLGLFVLSKNTSSPVNRLFCIAMLGATYWAAGEFLFWHTNSYESSLFWLKASSFWSLVIALTVHFVLVFTGHPLARREHILKLLIILYIPSLVFSILEIYTDSIYIVLPQAGSGYYYTPVYGSLPFQIESLYFLLIMLGAVYLSIQSWLRSHKERIRRQCVLISIGFLLVIGFGSQSVFYLPRSGIYIPNLVFFGIVLFSIIIAYTILKYGLFTLGPETVATNIIRTMPDGLILSDMDGRILSTNAASADLFQMKIEQMMGKQVGSLISDATFLQIINLVSESGSLSDYECVLTNSRKPVSIASSLVRDPEGDPVGIILIIRDITTRKSDERALQIANEKISMLSRLTRHDISNLVTPLQGYLTLLREDDSISPDNPHFIACITLVEKIAQHLQFSHECHKVGFHEPVWLNLEDVIQSARCDLANTGIQITVTVSPVIIYADPLFQKVIYNLFENASRHGGKITRITVSTRQNPGNDLLLTIEDDGEGIREEEKDLIFLHGYGKNSGLGLAMSREILSITKITITETGVYGNGARFELVIAADSWILEKSASSD